MRGTPGTGPCSPLDAAITIVVQSEGDIAKRLQFPSTTTVFLIFTDSLNLTRPLRFNASFSCTILQTAPDVANVTLFYHGFDGPVLSITGVGNMLLRGIGAVNQVGPAQVARRCALPVGGEAICPAIYIFQCHNVQITKAYVYGRIGVFQSVFITLDSLEVTMAPNPNNVAGYDADGIIHFRICGVGGSKELATSGNVVSNSRVYGGHSMVVMTAGAIGITLKNNYFHDFIWSALRCGNAVHETMSCALNLFINNYVTAPMSGLTGDSAGFYMTNKWFGPGNKFKCNYVFGGDHCYYFDFASSGIEVDGGVCAFTGTGIKWNNGKFNTVKNVIMHQQRGTMSFFSCITAGSINCTTSPGAYWEQRRARFFSEPLTREVFPYMETICQNPTNGPAQINKTWCSPRGSSGPKNGTCSGLPYNITGEFWALDFDRRNTPRDFCTGDFGAAARMSSISYKLLSTATAGFADVQNGDYGLTAASPIWQMNPDFTNCPRSEVGRQYVDPQSYFDVWNVPRPSILNDVIAAKWYFGGSMLP